MLVPLFRFVAAQIVAAQIRTSVSICRRLAKLREPFDSRIIEMHFPLRGACLPSDHAYALYGSICSHLPEVHEANWLGIHTVKGRKFRAGEIKLGRYPKLRMRLPIESAPLICKLAGANINVAGHSLQCGVPELHVLKPAKRLRSRLVVIKCNDSKGKTAEVPSFVESLKRQIDELGVSANVILEKVDCSLDGSDFSYARRILRVKSTTLTGFGVLLDNLSEADSIVIQESGLGGKRRMGCGLFEPFGRGE